MSQTGVGPIPDDAAGRQAPGADAASRKSVLSSAMEEASAGAVAGIVGTALGYPLDLVKARMQTHPLIYSSAGSTFLRIAREEGLRGLYRGVTMPLVSERRRLTFLFAIGKGSGSPFLGGCGSGRPGCARDLPYPPTLLF